jgi:hypothetical protein
MSTSEQIKGELKSLLDKKKDLIQLAKKEDILEFGSEYQRWYSSAYKLVEALAPERITEFSSYYLIDHKRKFIDAGNYAIQDYIKGIGASTDHLGRPLWDKNTLTILRVINQVQIIDSLSSRINGILQDVKGHLFAELQDAELQSALQLKKVSKRAAGALAGVVLERHLQRTASNHKIIIRKKSPTISDLNDPLKQASVYDVPTWRKIQLLADLRNICSHQKSSDPTEAQVDDLISGVNSVIKSVF